MMGNMEARIKIHNESDKRVKSIKFGDPITNICAGDENPQRLCYFTRYKRSSKLVECTDKKGKFWLTGSQVIYPDHLDYATCEKLFKPVWEANYGKSELAADKVEE